MKIRDVEDKGIRDKRKQRLNVPKPNQAWHAGHWTWLDSWYQLAR